MCPPPPSREASAPDLKSALRCFFSSNQTNPHSGNFQDSLKDLLSRKDDSNQPVARFSFRKPSRPGDDLCYVVPGRVDTLAACTFNRTSKTFLVIHGWLVSGKFSACCNMPAQHTHAERCAQIAKKAFVDKIEHV